MPTHWCDWDAPGRVSVRALCGALIRRRDHSSTPTCDTCREILETRARDDAATADAMEPAEPVSPISIHAVGCQCADCQTARIAEAWDPRMGPK